MQPDEIYRETVPFTLVKWILAMEIGLTILFLSLFISQLPAGLSWLYLGMFLLFLGVTVLIANFRKLNISISSQSITVAYSRIKYFIPWGASVVRNQASVSVRKGLDIKPSRTLFISRTALVALLPVSFWSTEPKIR